MNFADSNDTCSNVDLRFAVGAGGRRALLAARHHEEQPQIAAVDLNLEPAASALVKGYPPI